MIIDMDNGFVMDSKSIVGSGGVVAADLLAPPIIYFPHRLGGTAHIAVGAAVSIDVGEGKYGSTTFTALVGGTETGLIGRQVVLAVGAAAANASFHLFRGIYSGIGPQPKGFNHPDSTTPSQKPTTPKPGNTFTYLSSSTVVQGTYASPGDLVLIVGNGPAVAWCSDITATAANDSVSNCSTNSTATHDGTLAVSSVAGKAIVTTFDNPIAFAASGAQQGCRVFVNCM